MSVSCFILVSQSKKKFLGKPIYIRGFRLDVLIAGPTLDYNPPLRSSRQDIRGSIQFFHGDYQNGQEEKKVERQQSQPQPQEKDHPFYPIRRQLSSDTITLNQIGVNYKGGGDGFFLNDRDTTDGDVTKTSFADLTRIRANGDQKGLFT